MENQQAVFIDFENIALWAEREFYDFELTPLMEYLQSRGPAVVKRAYGDWGRFLRYRDELMNLSIDLIQIYSTRSGKNRADIRMAIDALEIAMSRSQVQNFVIVSGDSDFSPLVAKLREYGRYTLGIGPRSITHDLLVKSCDEFVYLETVLGETTDVDAQSNREREAARNIMMRALQAHGQRGELPVLAAKLKQTMLLMDPAFNEANFGYSQFKSWLEDSCDLIRLFVRDLQLYVSPIDYIPPGEQDLKRVDIQPTETKPEDKIPDLNSQYKRLFNQLKLSSADLATRRDVLRDIYRELNDRPGVFGAEELLDNLHERYESQDMTRSKPVLRDIFQMAARQAAYDHDGDSTSMQLPLKLAGGIDSEADFVSRAESEFVYEVIRAGLKVDPARLAYIILDAQDQTEYIQILLDDLCDRDLIAQKGKGYGLPGRDPILFRNEPALRPVISDIENVKVPTGMEQGSQAAHSLAKTAMLQRSQDFIAAASNFLLACRLMWEAVERSDTGATLQDLRWYLASYASAQAGKLSQVDRDYAGARPYYLAFFFLVQEDDPLWSRMRGLINPMLTYYWANMGRELDINTTPWNIGVASPAQIAVSVATHPSAKLHQKWEGETKALAEVNPGLLRRIADQIILNRAESPEHAQVAEQIQRML